MILSDLNDHFPIFGQVKELGDFLGNDDSERDLLFRLLLDHIQYEICCGIDNVDMLCGSFISDVTTAYDSVYPIISKKKKNA